MSKPRQGAVSTDIRVTGADDVQQQILTCLQRIECILKDAEADQLRAKREAKASLDERLAICRGQLPAAPTTPNNPSDSETL